jgi:hypothetical protein
LHYFNPKTIASQRRISGQADPKTKHFFFFQEYYNRVYGICHALRGKRPAKIGWSLIESENVCFQKQIIGSTVIMPIIQAVRRF